MNLDKESEGLFELIAWLKEFKAQQDAQKTHQPTLTVVPEQAELPLNKKPDSYRKLDRSAPNAGKPWPKKDSRIAWFASQGGCEDDEIATYLGRTEDAVDQQIDKIRKGHVKL